ncbi:transmembrane protein, putative (macronuclear) [Tetrahymena thermophila SB210]|uniref:Transmembrane protein, putative n=1 Tax=Tetrahymena thermophila (strain SB210) TaxID=312017 RepID=W7XKN3_TETTS|nr:transmembrane protein, putative [Tetrahymena thermophila SB210]EWS75064.1 transmembrane protein, putative [Tetrahymena thermophila SB210]|eukprot:XP_012652377.1 transmembrane protein, putative [Tetrahymena thermophila SB210]
MSQRSNILQNFDIFGSPFYQKVNQDDYKKKTTLGGFFSIMLILFTISYLLYLIIQVNSGQIPPNFIQYDENMIDGTKYGILSNNIKLYMSQQIPKIEQERKIQYFDISLQYVDIQSGQNITLNSYYINDNAFTFGESDPINLELKSNSTMFLFGSSITINISKCSGNLLRYQNFRCATQDEINEFLSDSIDGLDNQVRVIQMEYTKIPQIWAQVWAIASLLYLSRHIFQPISLTSLAQDFLSIQLKYYYKKTAIRLTQENGIPKQNESYQDVHQQAEFIAKQNEDIQSNKNYFEISRYQRWKTFLLPKIFLKKKKVNNQNQEILNLLRKQTNKDLCFFEMQKEFLRLKTAIKLLLTPEQYAAIHMCGCDLLDGESKVDLEQSQISPMKDSQFNQIEDIIEENSNLSSSDIQTPLNSYQLGKNIIQPSSEKVQNHLELMEKVDIDSDYRKSCLEKFLSENQQINQSEQVLLNQRIHYILCMVGIFIDLKIIDDQKIQNFAQFYNNQFKKRLDIAIMSQRSNILQNFDIFGSPFYQKVNQDDYKKKTMLGGFFSIMLILFTISYLLYLIIQVNSGQIPPSFIQYDENAIDGTKYGIQSNNILLFMSEQISKIEQERKIQYFDITLKYVDMQSGQNITLNSYYTNDYNDQALMFGESDPINLELKSNSTMLLLGSSITINIQKCSGNLLRYQNFRCATQDEINEFISDSIDGLARLQEVNIQKGLLFQSNQQHRQIYQLEQQNFISNNGKYAMDTYAEFAIYLDNQVRVIQMEYTKIPQIWAQVWAIASLLYLSRHIFQPIALTSLAQDFLSIQLKYYYKKTAIRLTQENGMPKQNESYQDVHQQAEFIAKQNEDIQSNKNYFEISRYQRWKTFLLPKIFLKKKKVNNQNQEILNLLRKQTNKDLCFFEMQKEFLRLKTAIKLLLTPEQYAAIHMCGCDLLDGESKVDLEQSQISPMKDSQFNQIEDIIEENSNLSSSDIQTPLNSYQIDKNIIQPSSEKVQNHLELMEKVDIDSDYRKSCLEKFLSENQQINQSEQVLLNQRIRNCIVGIQSDDLNTINQVNQDQYTYIEYNSISNNQQSIVVAS